MMATTTSAAVPKRQSGPHIWFTDSGASDHFSPHRELFSTFSKLDEPVSIETAEGAAIGTGMGTNHHYGTRQRRHRDGIAAQRRHLCTQHEFEFILTCGGIRQGVRDTNHTWIRPQNLPQRHPRRQLGSSRRRTLSPQDTHRCICICSTSHRNDTRARHQHLASTNGPSRRGLRQEVGKNGRWNENKIQDFSGSMRSMSGGQATQATISPTGNQGYGATRTHPQRPVWTNRPNNVTAGPTTISSLPTISPG